MRRVEQVAAVLKKELAPEIYKGLDNQFGIVTLTDIIVQSDLKEAKVFISCLDANFQKAVLKALNAKSKEYQHFLGRKLRMKFTPKLEFKPDLSLDNVIKVEKLLSEIEIKEGK